LHILVERGGSLGIRTVKAIARINIEKNTGINFQPQPFKIMSYKFTSMISNKFIQL